MTDLKKSLIWIAFYLLIVLVLGQLDRFNTPIINFVAYFYLTAIFVVLVMIFAHSLCRVSVVVPMIFWGAIYFALLRIIDRELTGSLAVEIIVLEIVILEVGVWLSYCRVFEIAHSKFLMNILPQGTFSCRANIRDAKC